MTLSSERCLTRYFPAPVGEGIGVWSVILCKENEELGTNSARTF